MAREWLVALKRSAQSELYEQSDWMHAVLVGQQLSDYFHIPAAERDVRSFDTLMKSMDRLMTTHPTRVSAKVMLPDRQAAKEHEVRPENVVDMAERFG